MALYGDPRDRLLFHAINTEIMEDIVEQEILYYKVNPTHSQTNMYGESLEKFFDEPVLLNPFVVPGSRINNQIKGGTDTVRSIQVKFYKPHLINKNIYCEVGDFIEWHQEFYEVKNIEENDFFAAKSENTHIEGYVEQFGYSVSIIVDADLIRPDKINIISGDR